MKYGGRNYEHRIHAIGTLHHDQRGPEGPSARRAEYDRQRRPVGASSGGCRAGPGQRNACSGKKERLSAFTPMTGTVYIVGAGPGAADLLTLKAAALLARAAVVLHDDLVPREILDLVSPAAELINVGKRCGRHGSGQEQINRLMIVHARRGRAVVRLKSGDPAVFGRLGEELEALREGEVPF